MSGKLDKQKNIKLMNWALGTGQITRVLVAMSQTLCTPTFIQLQQCNKASQKCQNFYLFIWVFILLWWFCRAHLIALIAGITLRTYHKTRTGHLQWKKAKMLLYWHHGEKNSNQIKFNKSQWCAWFVFWSIFQGRSKCIKFWHMLMMFEVYNLPVKNSSLAWFCALTVCKDAICHMLTHADRNFSGRSFLLCTFDLRNGEKGFSFYYFCFAWDPIYLRLNVYVCVPLKYLNYYQN